MPRTTASAYFCRPSGVFISAESAGFFMLPSSTSIDGYWARLSPAMSERGSGKIVNIGSVQSKLARETIVPYAASKGGVALLTQGMAADLARYGIQVNCLSPGYFQTDMNQALWQDADFNAWIEKRTPAQRWGQVEELVGTLIYLCSGASNFVSGQNVFVDGGMTSVV